MGKELGNSRSKRGRNAIIEIQLGMSHFYAVATPIGGHGENKYQ
jgi:hypothetical protein